MHFESTVLASAAGPAVLAQSRAATGDSASVMVGFAATAAALGLVSFFFRVPSAADGAWAQPADCSLQMRPESSR